MFFARPLLTRIAPSTLVAMGSLVVHAGVALALVTGGGGHAAPGLLPPVVVAVNDELATVIEAPAFEPVRDDHEHVQATHTHEYPVPPSHDARPHDPSLHHDALPFHHDTTIGAPTHHEDEPDHHAPAHGPAPAVASSSMASVPRFVLSSGASAGVFREGASDVAGDHGASASALAGDEIASPSAVQIPAKLVASALAAYPVDARADDVEGDVGVEIVVDRDGHVIDARVAHPAGHGFDDAALAAIRRYRFTAAQRDGHPVRVRMPWTVHFRLR